MTNISLVKFTFTPTGKNAWLEWCDELKKRSSEVCETLKNEGVRMEACFLSESENACYYVMQAEDIERALRTSEKSQLPIDIEHRNTFEKSLVYAEKCKPLFFFAENVDADELV